MPAARWRLITSAMASVTAASSAAESLRPSRSASRRSTTRAGRGRLPVWVVRIRSVLRCIEQAYSDDVCPVFTFDRPLLTGEQRLVHDHSGLADDVAPAHAFLLD